MPVALFVITKRQPWPIDNVIRGSVAGALTTYARLIRINLIVAIIGILNKLYVLRIFYSKHQ